MLFKTRVLKQAVRRNKERFPDDFMYEPTAAEIDDVVLQNESLLNGILVVL